MTTSFRSVAVTAALAALAPGGSNYGWFQVDRPQPGVCVREPYGVVANFDLARPQIENQIAQMVRSGQRRLRIGIFHWRGFDSGTLMDSTGGDLSPRHRRNLVGLLAAVKAAGIAEVEIAFHPEGVADWPRWDESRFQEYWSVIRRLRPLIRASGLSYRLDLANEAVPGPGQAMLLRYARRMWANYVRAYGRADTVGFSVIGDPAHTARLREVYGDKPPPVFDVHIYGGTSGLSEYQQFVASDAVMKRQGLRQPWIVGEAFYDDEVAADELRRAALATARPLYYLTQWPLTRDSACADVDVPAPTSFDAYLNAGFGWSPGRVIRAIPRVERRRLMVGRDGRARLRVGCAGTITRCRGTLALRGGGSARFALLPPQTVVRAVRAPTSRRAIVTLTARSDDSGGSTRRDVSVSLRR